MYFCLKRIFVLKLDLKLSTHVTCKFVGVCISVYAFMLKCVRKFHSKLYDYYSQLLNVIKKNGNLISQR